MKSRIALIACFILACTLLLVFTTRPEPVAEEVETSPTLAQQPSTDDYLKSTLDEAKYLLNSEDPRVWRRAMMSE